jgi:hypothetical protein
MSALTRNLYREDEVIAALRFSLVQGRIAAAVYWVQEGIESDMDVQIFQTLLSVWLNCVGVQNIPWLGWLVEALRGDLDEATIISLTTELAKSVKDSSVFALLAIGLERPTVEPDHVGKGVPIPAALAGRSPLEQTFAKALVQGKGELAFHLAAPLWSSGAADEILWEIQPLAVFNKIQDALEPIWSDEFIWSFRALAILMACSKRDYMGTDLPLPPRECVDDWAERKEQPMRKRRALSVPPECLYWGTKRGSLPVKKSVETDIMGNLRHMLRASPFWADKLEDLDAYLTSDIPDEWSSADRQKSHSRGILSGPTADHTLLLQGSLKRMYGVAPSKMIWGGLDRAIKILVERWSNARPLSFEQGILDAYTDMELAEAVAAWDLTPRRRILEVV